VVGFPIVRRNAKLGTRNTLITQFFDLVFIHAEVVSDFMEHGQADLFAEPVGVGKVLQVQDRSFRKRNTLVDAVQGVTARIESFGSQESPRRPLFYNELNVAQLFAKSPRQSIDDSGDFFSKLIVVQGPSVSRKWFGASSY
jgi:hypothetical protein